MKTKCAVIRESHKPLEIEELELPKVGRGQVLVKVHYSGICGTQINEIRGLKGEDKYLPHLLGHEAFATVLETGDGILKVKRDDAVVLTWIKGYGLDGGAKKYDDCNAGPITTFQEYSVVSENRLVRLKHYPRDVREIVLFGCMVPVGCGTVFHMATKETVRIFGVGNIGSAAVLAAHQLGKKVYVVDVENKKLDYALKLGADVLNYPTDPLAPVETAIDTTGLSEVIEQAFNSLTDDGTLIIVGNSAKGSKVSFPPFDFIKGKKVIGSWGGGCNPDVDISRLIDVVDVGNIPLKVYSLEDVNKALDDFRSGTCGKIILEC